jgi:hypothetical protein
MSSPLEILNQLFPQARVTSTRRDPNSRLGRANPRSYHNIGQAFDVAPIPGVQFNDYVNRLKSSGVNVVEALDEASHPLKHTTGPNWHIAYGGAQVAPQRKKPTLASIAKPDMGQMPVGLNAQPMQTSTLGDLALPQGDIPNKKPGLFGKGGDGWKILGILGDSYAEANGRPGVYIPQLLKNRQMEAEQAAQREEFDRRLELERQKALQPPQFAQNAAWFAQQPVPVQAQILKAQDMYDPRTVVGPQGTQLAPRLQTKQIGEKTYYNIGGEWYEEGE